MSQDGIRSGCSKAHPLLLSEPSDQATEERYQCWQAEREERMIGISVAGLQQDGHNPNIEQTLYSSLDRGLAALYLSSYCDVRFLCVI